LDGWRSLTYGQFLTAVEHIAQSLLDQNLSIDRPVLILSGNDIEHALLALACIHVGIPYAPISQAYSLISKDHSKLKDIVNLLNPGLIFAADGKIFDKAIAAVATENVQIFVTANPANPSQKLFAELQDTTISNDVAKAHEAIVPDTIAKFLFTSGTTGSPKAVINTNGMICANQAMVSDCYAFMRDTPPIVLDWAPWNHTAGGNKVFFMVMFNGGTLYIDDGRPTPQDMAKTVRNLRDVAPSWYFNVPKGFEELVRELEADDTLRDHFFSRMNMLMYSGAALAKHTWNALQRLSVEATQTRVLIASGLGATETSPFALMCTWENDEAGNVGLPAKGMVLKLVPTEGKLEARLKGPNITPGYWKEPKLTAAAFDEEGFYQLGDALRFADPKDASKGFHFDGRTAENFKLRSGTWVGVGALRGNFINHFAGMARDVVLTGLNEGFIGALVLPNLDKCREISGLDKTASMADLAANPSVIDAFSQALTSLAKSSTGSSTKICRMIIMDTMPSVDKGEVTDKGSLNQRAVLNHRAVLVAEIYAGSDRVLEL
ncbi:MAG: feruloyl-CoA synthase, partial [Hyphomicrobiales bacterium]